MNEEKYLIIAKGEDKTANISGYEVLDDKITLKYKNGRSYNYACGNVLIFKNGQKINIQNKTVYISGKLQTDIKKLIKFGDYYKVFYNDKTEVVSENNLIIPRDEFTDVMSYFKAISKYVNDGKDSSENKFKGTFLENEFEKLGEINNDSVLKVYLNKKSLEKNTVNNDELIFPFKFNLSQKEACENVFKSNISVIEGPPGTGKTQTILNIIANIIMQNKTVAVVSNNNEAVWNVRDKLTKYGYKFIMAELGKKDYRKKFFKNLPEICLDGFNHNCDYEFWYSRLRTLSIQLDMMHKKNIRKAELEREISDYKLEQQYFEIYYNKNDIDSVQKLSFYNKSCGKILNMILDLQLKYNGKVKDNLFYKAKMFFKYGLNLKNIDSDVMNYILSLQKKFYELKIADLEKEYQDITIFLENNEFSDLSDMHQKISENIFKQKLYEKYKDMKFNFTFTSYKHKMNEFMKCFPVLLSTTYSLRNSIDENFLFDYVIIDESSQVDLLAGSLALSCAKAVVVVGDTKQLPQIIDNKIQKKISSSNVDNCYNYFEQSLLSSLLLMYKDVPRVILKEHYRCNPKIIEFCNKRYYNGELISFSNSENSSISKPLELYYTVAGNHMRKITDGENKGTYNQREIDVIKQEVLSETGYKESDIGVTSPYRLQANLLEQELDSDAQCDTIHKYQGREKKVMILSTVLDSSELGKKGISFVDDPCMINVAVSRAICKFIMVTDDKLFNSNGSEIKSLIKYMKYNTLDAKIVNSELVSVFDLLYKNYSNKLEGLNKRLRTRSRFKSENIIDTILFDEFQKEDYKDYSYTREVFLKNLVNDYNGLNEEEINYIKHLASIDFVIYDKMDGEPILLIEVDGFNFHKNNPEQLRKDLLKDAICDKKHIPLMRFATDKTYDEKRIVGLIRESLSLKI